MEVGVKLKTKTGEGGILCINDKKQWIWRLLLMKLRWGNKMATWNKRQKEGRLGITAIRNKLSPAAFINHFFPRCSDVLSSKGGSLSSTVSSLYQRRQPEGRTGAGLRRCPWDCPSPLWSPASPAQWGTSGSAAPWQPSAASRSSGPAPGSRRSLVARAGGAPSRSRSGGTSPVARSHLAPVRTRAEGGRWEEKPRTEGWMREEIVTHIKQ